MISVVLSDMSHTPCYICSAPGVLQCPDCPLSSCCQEHDDLHRGDSCYPLTVLDSDGVGRYVVASRDIAQGVLVFAETEPLGKGSKIPPQ